MAAAKAARLPGDTAEAARFLDRLVMEMKHDMARKPLCINNKARFPARKAGLMPIWIGSWASACSDSRMIWRCSSNLDQIGLDADLAQLDGGRHAGKPPPTNRTSCATAMVGCSSLHC
ncbi:hypothetical protein JIN92_40570 [Burkholderia contaminans]|nr:hypothetical protein [Burkholderia contaminans]UTP27155.1 hypothetical protein NMB33_39940 [Burkholderia sp. FXe9]UTP27183.1 hypothetical protein NMB33_33580 [Burkholderia sp. FXe9]